VQHGKRILVVDDNPNDLELAQLAFEQGAYDHQLLTAQGGREALAALRREAQDGKVSLVLLDLKMPQMDGLAVLDAIKQDKTLQQIPVVMLSTSRERGDISECYRRGANAYVVKPLDFSHFVETVRTTLTFWTMTNEAPL
jgi:CheY-like chemotaxis protein